MGKTTGKSANYTKEKYAEPCSSHSKDLLIGGLIGGMIGAAAALLLAPKSGKELRSDLASTEGGQYICQKANELKQKSEELTEQYKAATTEISEKVAEQYSLICENINALKQTLIDAQAEVMEEIKEELEEEK